MKKYLLLFMVVIVSNLIGTRAVAQYYRLEYDVNFSLDECSSAQRYYVDYMRYTTATGATGDIHDFEMDKQRNTDHVVGSIQIPATAGPITKIVMYEGRQKRGGSWHNVCGNNLLTIFTNPSIDNCANINPTTWDCLSDCSTITINTFKFYPVISDALAMPLDRALPTEDPITIASNYQGFPASVYNWQFSTDGTTWLPFPSQYQGLPSNSLTATQLFAGSGLNTSDLIGKNVMVRFVACNGNTASDVVTYNVRKSPPNITNVTVTPPNCFDTDDGRLKFTFDRALAVGERIRLNLRDAIIGNLVDSYWVTQDSLDASNSYIWPQGLTPSNYFAVYYGAFVYTDASNSQITSNSNIKQSSIYSISAPTPVSFTTSKVDVWCHAGNDGTITTNATGGVGSYRYMIKRNGQPDSTWYPFSSATQHTITGLTANAWQVQVRDGNQCIAKTGAGGSTVTQTLAVAQPSAALQNNTVAVINPTGYGLSDGSYNFQWATLAGTPINTGIATNVTGTGYRIKLANLPDGTYVLSSNDNNNASATNHQGCLDMDTFFVVQPQPLIVKINIKDSILCMGDANGSLVAHGVGGIRFSGKPYIYTWKKKNGGGTYAVLPSQTDSLATNLATGWYAVNIRDANGIVLANDSTFFLPEPTLLQVGITHVGVTCSGLPNGSAIATATGGTPYYTYAWNTGEATTNINNLLAGTYLIFVKDRHGCQVQKNVVIQQPNAMSLTFTEQQPACNNSCDGKLTANLTGGTSPYTYQWLGSSTTTNIAPNLCSGNYQVAITDGQGCSILLRDTLINPSPLPLSLGADRFICADQGIAYNITIPNRNDIVYRWTGTSGFTSSQPAVTLTSAGTYYASVTDANNCNSRDTLVLTSAGTTISNEFALPTQAFVNEQVVVVNTSNPAADSVKWEFPPQGAVIQQSAGFATFNIPDTGTYYLKFTTYRGLCFAEQTKKIIVSDRTGLNTIGSTKNPFITSFTVAPNPSHGSFNANIILQSKADVELRLINILTNQITILSHQSGFDSYAIPIHVSATPGTYILLLETPNGTASMKIVIL